VAREVTFGVSEVEFNRLKDAVRKVGEEHGAARGSWVVDGNTTKATAERLVKGLDDGDPEVIDSLPELRIGEWADDPSENDIVSEAVYAGHIDIAQNELAPEEVDELIGDYMDGWYSGMQAEVERSARAVL